MGGIFLPFFNQLKSEPEMTKKTPTTQPELIGEVELLKTIDSIAWYLGPWKTTLWQQVAKGLKDHKQKAIVRGFLDGHTHLCRAGTYKDEFLPTGVTLTEIADAPLEVKQNIIGDLHNGPAYSAESLLKRMEWQIQRAIQAGTREMWAVTDTTADIGLRAFDIALGLKEKYKKQITTHVGCYPVFGLKNPLKDKDQLDVLEAAAKKADFIVGLPEKDEDEKRIGFKGHTSILLRLGYQHKIPVHMHADQGNTAFSRDSFRVIECLEGLSPEKLRWYTESEEPRLWLVHVISPSCYEPHKFSRLVNMLKRYNVGVVVCPRAALSMREPRSEKTPTHNSVARVVELLSAEIRVRLGTDNVNDIFVPSGDGIILTEVDILVDMIRNYVPHIWAKVSIGIPLNSGDRAALDRALYEKLKVTKNHAEAILRAQKPEAINFEF